MKTGKEPLLKKTVNQIRSLFGTPRHALEVLGLQGEIDYNDLYRGLNGTPISAEAAFIINRAMARWCKVYLKEGWDNALKFDLPSYSENDESWKDLKPPTWTPPE